MMFKPFLVITLATAVISAVTAEDVVDTLPPLPPQPVKVPANPDLRSRNIDQEAERPIDRQALISDLNGLLRIRERVRQRMLAGEVPGINSELVRQRIEDERQRQQNLDVVQASPEGLPQDSQHLPMQVQRWSDGGVKVNASIRQERVDTIYRELVALINYSLDDQQVNSGALRVSLHVQELPWQQALSRMLGQVGLSWRLDGDRVVIFKTDYQNSDQEEASRLAELSFLTAAAGSNGATAAEAMYRLARQEHRNLRYNNALDRYIQVIQDFDSPDEELLPAREWVRRSLRGYGEVMMDLKQYRAARNVFVRYLSTVSEDDPTVPVVMYQAAKASLALADIGGEQEDETAVVQASDLLELLIERYSNSSNAEKEVVQARLDLGRLLFDRGQYARAKAMLEAHRQFVGDQAGDQLLWMIAECEYYQGLARRDEDLLQQSENHFAIALEHYRLLGNRLLNQQVDPLADNDIYRRSLFRVGQCFLHRPQPDYVQALFSFLQAKNLFRETPLEVELTLNIVRCYAELERHEETVAELFHLLNTVDGEIDPSLQLEQLIADIDSDIADYAGSLTSRIDYYIAQGRYRAAMWAATPSDKQQRMRQAISRYERILDNDGASASLVVATQLAIARAALAIDDRVMGEQMLRQVITNSQSSPRDIAFAARLLGDHYRSQGRYEDAINAYRANIGGQSQ